MLYPVELWALLVVVLNEGLGVRQAGCVAGGQIFLDGGEIGDNELFAGDLFFVPGEVDGREDGPRQMEARPGPPGSQGGMFSRHAGGEMLEMADWIAEEEVGFPVNQKPDESRVGRGQGGDEGRFVELENGLGRLALSPEGLGEFEAGAMEERATVPTVRPGVPRIEVGRGIGEMRIEHRDDLRFPVASWRVTIEVHRWSKHGNRLRWVFWF